MPSSPSLANAWLQYLAALAEKWDWALVTWWSDMDLLFSPSLDTCPCAVPPEFEPSCVFISAFRELAAAAGEPPVDGEIEAKAFGAMGLRELNGTKTLLWDTLQKARKGP